MELILLLIILLFVSRFYTKSSKDIGKEVESKINKILNKSFVNERSYIFKDIIIEYNGRTTQIDQVIITEKGVFVIETKNYSGWIFGSAGNSKWTQVLYKNKYQFQNPLRQNYAHIKVLQDVLELEFEKFISIIVFTNKSEFKTDMPENVIKASELKRYISSFSETQLSEYVLYQLNNKIQLATLKNSTSNRKKHIKNLKERKSEPKRFTYENPFGK